MPANQGPSALRRGLTRIGDAILHNPVTDFARNNPFTTLGIVAGMAVAGVFTAGAVLLPMMFLVTAKMAPFLVALTILGSNYLFHRNTGNRLPLSVTFAMFALGCCTILTPVLGVLVTGLMTTVALGAAAVALAKAALPCLKSCFSKIRGGSKKPSDIDSIYDNDIRDGNAIDMDALRANDQEMTPIQEVGLSSSAQLVSGHFAAKNTSSAANDVVVTPFIDNYKRRVGQFEVQQPVLGSSSDNTAVVSSTPKAKK